MVHFTTLSNEEPAAFRHTFMFSSTMRACLSTVTSGILPVRRSIGVRPETKTKLPARITGLSGMPSFLRCRLPPGTSMPSCFTVPMALLGPPPSRGRLSVISIFVKHLLNRRSLARDRQCQHEQDARLLRHQVVADDEAVGVLLRRGHDAAVPGAGGED